MSIESIYKIINCARCGKELDSIEDRKVYIMARELEMYGKHGTYGFCMAKETGFLEVVCENCKDEMIGKNEK